MVLNTQTLQVDGRMDGLDGSLGLVEYRAPYGANNGTLTYKAPPSLCLNPNTALLENIFVQTIQYIC